MLSTIYLLYHVLRTLGKGVLWVAKRPEYWRNQRRWRAHYARMSLRDLQAEANQRHSRILDLIPKKRRGEYVSGEWPDAEGETDQ